MYVCGITVYDDCHIGHARTIVVFDILRRYLIHKGKELVYVQNFTDVDDKIINRAKLDGKSPDEISSKYTESYFEDFSKRSEEHTSELQSLMRISYAVFCLKK